MGNRAGGDWEYEEDSRKFNTSYKGGTGSSSYPVVPSLPSNDEFRPKKESDVKQVRHLISNRILRVDIISV